MRITNVQVLTITENQLKDEMSESVLFNSTNLFQSRFF